MDNKTMTKDHFITIDTIVRRSTQRENSRFNTPVSKLKSKGNVLTYSQHGNFTNCVIQNEQGEVLGVGSVKRNPKDKNKTTTGLQYAFVRAVRNALGVTKRPTKRKKEIFKESLLNSRNF